MNYGERCSRSTKECLKVTILSLREELNVGDSAGAGDRTFSSEWGDEAMVAPLGSLTLTLC